MNALIVNCKSGGHAFIGYYLAKQLRAKGHNVTIMNDGEQVRRGMWWVDMVNQTLGLGKCVTVTL